MRRNILFYVFGVLVAFVLPPPALTLAAEKWPTRPLKFIVPMSPGGSGDLISRKLVDIVGKALGQKIVVTNMEGAGSVLGDEYLAKSKPDGYTIGVIMSSVFVTAPSFTKLNFDPPTAFSPIIQHTTLNSWMMVLADSPFQTLKDYLEEGRKRQVTMAGVGMNSANVAVLRLAKIEKANVRYLPFGGAATSMTALLGGQSDAWVGSAMTQYIRAGKTRMIARFNGEPKKGAFKDIPTLGELGYDIEATSFGGIAGPKGLPEPIRKRLEDEFTKALHTPAILEFMVFLDHQPTYRNGKDFGIFLKQMYERGLKENKEMGLGLFAPDKKG